MPTTASTMPPPEHADLLITGLWLLPTAYQQDAIAYGGVAVAGDRIIAVGRSEELAARFPNAQRLHEEHGLIMPGLINTHTHAAMACFRGLADDLPLMTWLQDHIFPAEARLTPEVVYHSTLLSLAEMIKSGTTSFCDMYLFAGRLPGPPNNPGCAPGSARSCTTFPHPIMASWKTDFPSWPRCFAAIRATP